MLKSLKYLFLVIGVLCGASSSAHYYLDFDSFIDKNHKPEYYHYYDGKGLSFAYVTPDGMYILYFQILSEDSDEVSFASWGRTNMSDDANLLPEELEIPAEVLNPNNGKSYKVTEIGLDYDKFNYSYCISTGFTHTNGESIIDYPGSEVRKAKRMIIPASVKKIDHRNSLSDSCVDCFIVDPDNMNYMSDEAGAILTKDCKTIVRFPAGAKLLSYTISSTVEELFPYAFRGCQTPVIFQSSIAEISDRCFFEYVPASIKMPANVDRIAAGAFNNSYITHINIPTGCKEIDSSAFYGTDTEWVSIPRELKEIGEKAFFNADTYCADKYYDTNWRTTVMRNPPKGIAFAGGSDIDISDKSFQTKTDFESDFHVEHIGSPNDISFFVNPAEIENFKTKAKENNWSDLIVFKDWTPRLESCIYTSQWVIGQMQCFTTSVPLSDDIEVASVEWYSDNPSIVAIDDNGLATATAEGKTDIHAKIIDTDGNETILTITLDGSEGIAGVSESVSGNHDSCPSRVKGVYNLHGIRLADTLDGAGLPAGIYIANGKKAVVR